MVNMCWSLVELWCLSVEFGGLSVNLGNAGVKGHNANSIHVCYVGGIDKSKNPKDTRTEAQRETLNTIIGGLLKEYPNASVHGHNEFANKACPSFDVQKEFGVPTIKVKKATPKKSKSTPKTEE